jgi:hypothetical protein
VKLADAVRREVDLNGVRFPQLARRGDDVVVLGRDDQLEPVL